MAPLWAIFLTLHRRRSAGFDAPNPLSYSEVEAFCRLTRTTLSAWEVDLLMRLDDATLGAYATDRTAARERARRASPASDGPVEIPASNTAAVKALFRDLAIRREVQMAAKAAPQTTED